MMGAYHSFVDDLVELDLVQTRARVAAAMTALKEACASLPGDDGEYLRTALRQAEDELLSGARRSLWKIDAALQSHALASRPAAPAQESRYDPAPPGRLPRAVRPQLPVRRPT